MDSFLERVDGGVFSTRFVSRQFEAGEEVAAYDHKTLMQSAMDVAKGVVTDVMFGIAFRNHVFIRVVKGGIGTRFNMMRDQADIAHICESVFRTCHHHSVDKVS